MIARTVASGPTKVFEPSSWVALVDEPFGYLVRSPKGESILFCLKTSCRKCLVVAIGTVRNVTGFH